MAELILMSVIRWHIFMPLGEVSIVKEQAGLTRFTSTLVLKAVCESLSSAYVIVLRHAGFPLASVIHTLSACPAVEATTPALEDEFA